MRAKQHPFLVITGRILFGLLVLFVGYRIVVRELHLIKSENVFQQIEHPERTERVDSLVLEFSGYSATYADDSIPFESAFLVGEIRSYDGDWDALKASYAWKQWDGSGMIPLQIKHDDQKSWLAFPDDFSFDPSQADILQALQEHYSSAKLTQQFGEMEREIYFVYLFTNP